MRRKMRERHGMSLVELIVVLAIIAILAAIAIPTFSKLGFFSRNEVQSCARELYALLRAAKIYAATWRVDTALVYGISLRLDSVTGQAVEAIDSAAMVYKIPQDVLEKSAMYTGLDANYLSVPIVLWDSVSPTFYDHPITMANCRAYGAYIPVTGETGGGIFRTFPKETALFLNNPFLDGSQNLLATTLQQVRVYQVDFYQFDQYFDPHFSAKLVPPLRFDPDDPENSGVLGVLPPCRQYWLNLPHDQLFMEYQQGAEPARLDNAQDFCFPAHVFTPSGRMEFPGSGPPCLGFDPNNPRQIPGERVEISVGFAPDADPAERIYVNPSTNAESDRTLQIELYRSTGRVLIKPEEG
jgi:prepilin-type N-terminal cleavage/methylation domain-containing protein